MDAPVKELERMKALWEEGRRLLEHGQLDEALAIANEALAIEEINEHTLTLKAKILEKLGKAKQAEQLRLLVKQIQKEAWQKKVEAEARGQHELMGESVRHEKL